VPHGKRNIILGRYSGGSFMERIIKMLKNKCRNIYENQKKKKDGLFYPQNYDISYIINGKSWFADYTDYDEFISDKDIQEYIKKLDVIACNFTFPDIKAYCEVCEKTTPMKHYMHSITESYSCCGMNSRMRAMYEYITTHFQNKCKVYISEAVTSAYRAFEKYFGHDNIIGSEYLGKNMISGEYYECNNQKIMHQDCKKMSFKDRSFDLIVSQHVFEHIFDVRTALSELLRILKDNGYCIVSIPFFKDSRNSLMLAKENEKGQIEQIINPPEIHGNPVGEGALAFWHHGWEFIDHMKEAGYRDVKVHFYNNVYKGHFGVQSIISGKK
jgi:SAM-dependent methyltransferase